VCLRACTYLGGVSYGCWGVPSRPNEGDVVQDLLRKSVRQCRCHTPAAIQHTAIAIRPERLGEGLCRTDRKCICYCAIASPIAHPEGDSIVWRLYQRSWVEEGGMGWCRWEGLARG
jgi:hypothetical protein